MEKGTGLPLPFANIFINNTTIGSATDLNGKYLITGEIPETFELVASFVGYETVTIEISVNQRTQITQDFELKAYEDNLTEIELKARRDKNWERNMKKFRDIFLALPTDPYSKEIEIHNPWVVDFEKINPKNGPKYVKASAQEPLKITNKALGYEIDYYLKDFRMLRNASRFYGQVFYKELENENIAEDSIHAYNKEINYLGSVRHFLKSLLLSRTNQNGFGFYKTNYEQVDRVRTNDFNVELGKSITFLEQDSVLRRPLPNGNFRIFLSGKIEVHYFKKEWPNDYYTNIYHPISWIEAPDGYFDIDRNGVLLNPTQLILSGHMGRQRVARTLPLDFQPDGSFTEEETLVAEMLSEDILLHDLREKPWISTNKAFYYPGEYAWVGGRMLYQNEILADTLSRVVYMDLVNKDLEIVLSETFQIEEEKISGGFQLPDALAAGDYMIRAYTLWSQNFGQRDIFQLPIFITNPDLLPKEQQIVTEEYSGELQVKSDFTISDSLDYRVLDLDLNFLDSFENPINAGFLLTVTDPEIAPEILGRPSLFEASDWMQEKSPSEPNTITHPIEYGISLSGNFQRTKSRFPYINPITIVRDDLADFGIVKTDSLGNFWATGLNFTDSAQISIAALDERQQPYGTVSISPIPKPVVSGPIPKLTYELKSVIKEEVNLDKVGDYILLDEFVREEKKQETMAERNYGYGEPDREIKGDDLLRMSPEAIMSMLGIKAGGKIGNFNFGQTTGMPLLIVDGQSFPFLSSDDFGSIMSSFAMADLESISVYTLSAPVFGMAGYAGVIKIETRNGQRFGPESEKKFKFEGFQIFPMKGYSNFSPFPKNPPSGTFLQKKPTIYWDPVASSLEGVYNQKITVPFGVTFLNLRIEGKTEDGEYFSQIIKLSLK